jgi:hypothetical protein
MVQGLPSCWLGVQANTTGACSADDDLLYPRAMAEPLCNGCSANLMRLWEVLHCSAMVQLLHCELLASLAQMNSSSLPQLLLPQESC